MIKKNLTVEKLADGRSRVSGNCSFTGQPYECLVPTLGLETWQGGAPIQVAMSEVPAEVREFLISGISPQGWRETFGR